MDGTWGRNWDGSLVTYDRILKNNLYEKLIDSNTEYFNELLTKKWDSLRIDALQIETLIGHLDNYKESFVASGVYDRENNRWDSELDIEEEYLYIKSWLSKRLEFLDGYFSN